jgi:hypothetical protein
LAAAEGTEMTVAKYYNTKNRPLWILAVGLACSLDAAPLPVEWRQEQPFTVTAPGLVKLSLPVETLDAARAGLEDLRVYDGAGNELPYLIERPRPAGKVVQHAKSFQVALNPAATVITLESGLTQPVDGVILESPAASFIKSVKVEGSGDGNRWQVLAQGQAVFRQPGGVEQVLVPVTPGKWGWLRLTVDDQRTPPVPFTGARVQSAAGESAPNEPLAVRILDRNENPGETRLTLQLAAANLELAEVRIDTPEPLFTRQVTVAVPQVSDDGIREQPLAQGVIYRVAIDGQAAVSNLTVRAEAQVRSRELLVTIHNQDSPPLAISAVQAGRRPVYLAFFARQPGVHFLLTGNRQCPAPRYDLSALGANLKNVPVSPLPVPVPVANPAYRPPEVLSGIENQGAVLDVSPWQFRKALRIAADGAQQIELDLEVLAHAQPGQTDLRLLRAGGQLPYLVERTSIHRALTPSVTATNDPKNPQVSRWILHLPQPNLPVTRLGCVVRTALFQRDMVLYEDIVDGHGDTTRRTLGQAVWVQRPDRNRRDFVLPLTCSPQGDTLILETQNGDNPPIDLEQVQVFYPVTRVLFKATAGDSLQLYYGNPEAVAPRYDLSLVAGELLAADRTVAEVAPEERLRKGAWEGHAILGKSGVLFWAILAVVVVGLLVIIARLLPKPPEADSSAKEDKSQ